MTNLQVITQLLTRLLGEPQAVLKSSDFSVPGIDQTVQQWEGDCTQSQGNILTRDIHGKRKIEVKTATGKHFSLKVELTETVDNMKAKIVIRKE